MILIGCFQCCSYYSPMDCLSTPLYHQNPLHHLSQIVKPGQRKMSSGGQWSEPPVTWMTTTPQLPMTLHRFPPSSITRPQHVISWSRAFLGPESHSSGVPNVREKTVIFNIFFVDFTKKTYPILFSNGSNHRQQHRHLKSCLRFAGRRVFLSRSLWWLPGCAEEKECQRGEP